MTKNYTSDHTQIHLRLPSWLMERIAFQAEAVGQTSSAEIRRALVGAFGKDEPKCCQCPKIAESNEEGPQ